MNFVILMGGLAELTGLPDLSAAAGGTVELEIDGMRLTVVDLSEAGAVAVTAEVGEIPQERADRFYRALLLAMHPGGPAADCVFSIDPEAGRVHLRRTDSLADLTVESFAEKIEVFVSVLEEWQRLALDFRDYSARQPSEEPVPDEPFPGSGFMAV